MCRFVNTKMLPVNNSYYFPVFCRILSNSLTFSRICVILKENTRTDAGNVLKDGSFDRAAAVIHPKAPCVKSVQHMLCSTASLPVSSNRRSKMRYVSAGNMPQRRARCCFRGGCSRRILYGALWSGCGLRKLFLIANINKDPAEDTFPCRISL